MTQEEIKKMTWQLQVENDIYDAVDGWDYHRFACLMKDNSIQIFTGMRDESDDGEIHVYLDCVENCLSYDVDDIVMWIEIPDIES